MGKSLCALFFTGGLSVPFMAAGHEIHSVSHFRLEENHLRFAVLFAGKAEGIRYVGSVLFYLIAMLNDTLRIVATLYAFKDEM